MPAERHKSRTALALVLGFIGGLATAAGFQYWFTVAFKRAEQGVYTLTTDISPETLYAFSDGPSGPGPLRGLIKAGSQYTVEMRKGSLSYICFRTVIASPYLKRVSGPIEPLARNIAAPHSPPLRPFSASRPKRLTPACSGLAALATDARR